MTAERAAEPGRDHHAALIRGDTIMHPHDELRQRRSRGGISSAAQPAGIGAAALASLLAERHGHRCRRVNRPAQILAARAKRVIYLFMHGGPSQMDLFDYKPHLRSRHGEELPASIRMNQRLTTMSSNQKSLPVAPSPFKFAQHGRIGRLDQRAAAAPGDSGRRPVHHPFGAHRGDQPRPGRDVPANRPPAAGPSQLRKLGQLRPGKRKPRPAGVRRAHVARQCGSRRPIRSTRGCGARPFFPRTTRAWLSAPAAIRCSTCPIPKASRATTAGGCSTRWRN